VSDVPALLVEAATVRFGSTVALDGLDLRAGRGEVTAVLGPNGAGKTTLIRACTDLVSLDEGSITVLGLPSGHPDLLARVGVMPQSSGAWSAIRAGELVRYLATLHARPHDPDALMERLHITAYASTPYRRLSGGQQQAVNLAGALVGRPELVVLDEPTAGMDPHARRRTWQLVRDLREAGVSVLLTTHAMDEAQELADTVHVLDRGRVVLRGAVADLTATRSLEDVFLDVTQDSA